MIPPADELSSYTYFFNQDREFPNSQQRGYAQDFV